MAKVYTIEDIAKGLNCSKKTVYKWINEGQLEAFRVGGLLRVTKPALEKFLGIPIPWENGE